MRQSRISVEAMLDAPDTTAARPGLRLRIAGLAVVVLFALLGLRLWTLQVLQAPAAAQAVTANQIRDGLGRADPRPHPRPLRQPARRRQRSPSRSPSRA